MNTQKIEKWCEKNLTNKQMVISKPEKRWEQAVRLAKEGKTYWQIAKEMGISQQGVWLHLTSHGYSLSQLKPKTHKHSPKTE